MYPRLAKIAQTTQNKCIAHTRQRCYRRHDNVTVKACCLSRFVREMTVTFFANLTQTPTSILKVTIFSESQ